jgi:hypothetical protein
MADIVRVGWAFVVTAGVWGLGGAAHADAGGEVPSDGGVIFQPGTQPNTLKADLRPPSLCENCHGIYAPYGANDTWQGTMMANAARDPLFYAALSVANQDITNSGEICIRCHSPRAWLFGRSMPPLVANFLPDDLEGVQCDFCHRLTSGPDGETHIGNARYFVGDDFIRRGPIEDSPAPHDWQYSPYFRESRLCGLCHDVSNPFRGGFAIERTYTEWLTSSFAAEEKSCQACHLPSERGKACGAPGMPERDVHRHELAGGNYWMPLVLAGEYPELARGPAYQRTAENAMKMLERAATVAISSPPSVVAGESLSFSVKVTNETGHKLPTGYPEGRRMWLEAIVSDDSGKMLLHSGAYDAATATRADDPDLRTYEVRLAAAGVEGFHFILQDELIQDNRIPPRGFVPRADTRPVGRDYAVTTNGPDGSVVLAHWDDAPYSLRLPLSVKGRIEIRITLWYQTTSREYVESLRDGNRTDQHGRRMHELWEKYDRAPPFAVAKAIATLDVLPPPERPEPPPDASAAEDASLGGDAPVEGGLPGADPATDEGGCGCRLASQRRGATPGVHFVLLAIGSLYLLKTKRRGLP